MLEIRRRTYGFVLILVMGIVLLMGCDIIDNILEALSDMCSEAEYLVTKTADTNDGECGPDDCSLREAIMLTNVCPGHQIIRVPAGTYVLDRVGVGEDVANTGDLDILDDLTILGDGFPTIDGNATDRVFEIFQPAVVSIENLVIQNGLEQSGAGIENHGELAISNCLIQGNHTVVPPGGSGTTTGGGIFSGQSASMTILDSQIENNTAAYGGGIANFVSDLTVTNTRIAENVSSHFGGGLWNQIAASATLNDVSIEGNSAAVDGGGIYNVGTLEVNGGNLTLNSAPRGGGLFNSGDTSSSGGTTLGPGEATLSSISIDNNTSAVAGAGVYNGGGFELHRAEFGANGLPAQGGGMFNAVDAEAYLYDAWFTNNTAELGGGVYNQGLIHFYRSSFTVNSAVLGFGGAIYNVGAFPGVLLQNVTVSGNMANPPTPGGAGIYNHGGDLDISFSTIAYNSPDGILNDGGGHLVIKSSIVAHHAVNCGGVGNPSAGYNIDDGNTCGFIEPTDLVSTSPLLAWLAMNGGTNLSHAPVPGSPAIDTGDPDMCIADDQRAVARPQGVRCDRGSIELTEDPLPGSEDAISMEFYDDGHELIFGQCTTLHWIVENATSISLNGDSVEPQGLEYICPQSTTTYILHAQNAEEQKLEAITIEVYLIQPPASPAQLSIFRRACNPSTYVMELEWIDMAHNETGYRVYRNGELIATLGANEECYTDNPPRGMTHTYGVEAYNGAGASSRPTVREAGCYE